MKQQLLFKNIEEAGLSIDDVASQLDVSTASVRNWIKTGHLNQINHRMISRRSFKNFRNNVAGNKKLTARANKSFKDSHNHEKVQKQFYDLINRNEIDLKNIGARYEESLSDVYRNKEGIYYTPEAIAKKFFQFLPDNCSDLSFCDPCCGSGNFIIAAIDHGIKPENIYGYDTDPIAVELTKKRILEHTRYKTKNVECKDFLQSSIDNENILFDIIFTNPPWGKKINKEQKKTYARIMSAGKSFDTSSLFFFECLSRLNKNGYLGLLLQDAFFNIGSFEHARKKALSLDIKVLIDFGKPFKGLLTKTKCIILQKKNASDSGSVRCEANNRSYFRSQSPFNENPKSILNFSCSAKESEVIKHLYTQQHITLSGKAKYGLGIVTGNNRTFCIKKKKINYTPVYVGTDIHKNGIKKPSNYIPDNLSLYQQVAPEDLYLSKEKLMYRFISSDLIFYHDTKQRFFLNSVNMLVLEDDFPISAKQLCQILNSKVIGWLFRSIFETCKVLQSDIEMLPIHTKYFDVYSEFTNESFLQFLDIEEHYGTYRIKK